LGGLGQIFVQQRLPPELPRATGPRQGTHKKADILNYTEYLLTALGAKIFFNEQSCSKTGWFFGMFLFSVFVVGLCLGVSLVKAKQNKKQHNHKDQKSTKNNR